MTGILNALIAGVSGAVKDAYFNLVSLLVPGNGTNGKQNNSFKDSSVNDFLITPNGNATQGTFSPFSQTGWGNYFNGSSYLIGPTSNATMSLGTDAYTVEGWVYLTSYAGAGNESVIFCAGNATNAISVSVLFTGAFNLSKYGVGTVIATSANEILLNTWYHVAVSRASTASNDTKLYINGVLKATGTDNNNWTVNTTPTVGALTIANYGVSGYLSNVRVVKGVAVYTGAFTPPILPLTATQSAGTNIAAITGTQTSLLTCQSNRFRDASNNALTITTSGSPSVTPFSPFAPTQPYSASAVGGSGYFDGNSDFLQLADNTSLRLGTSAYTVEFWWYPVSSAAAQVFMAKAATGDGAPQAYYAWSTGRFYWYSGTTDIFSTSYTVALNQWYHVAFVRTSTSSNDTRFYINGSLVATSTDATDYTSTAVLNIGGQGGGTFCVNGYLSNFRLVKGTAITPPSGGPTAPLTAVSGTSLLLNFTNAGVVDATAKNVLETVGNAQISTSVSKFGGGSMYFNGSSSYLMGAANQQYEFGSGDFTVECWVNISAAANYGGIISKGPVGSINNTTWTLEFNGSGNTVSWLVYAASTSYIINGTSNIKTSSWIHLAVTRSGNNTRLFVNGTQEGSTYTGSYTIATGNNLYIGGGFYSPTTNTITGYVDDVRLTKFARYVEGTGGNAGKMVFNGTNTLALPTAPFPVQ